MKWGSAAVLLCLCAAPALAADFELRCDLGDPYGSGNYCIWGSNNGQRYLHCNVGCTATASNGETISPYLSVHPAARRAE